jgi:hypothetical protein
MNASIECVDGKFVATLDNGGVISAHIPVILAKALLGAGVEVGNVVWPTWTAANKFEDLMQAAAAGDITRMRLYEFELLRRLS